MSSLPAVKTNPTRTRALLVLALVLLGGVVVPPSGSAFATPAARPYRGPVEPYQPYAGQSTCDPTPKPGVAQFRSLILAAYPGTGAGTTERGCNSGGKSEHKEGRAWDWGVRADVPAQKAAAGDLLEWLLATDSAGNAHAIARRLGLMYVIWDHRIWKSYQADKGWQQYTGSNPHTDHVHFSFSWPGALGQTSFFYPTDWLRGYALNPANPAQFWKLDLYGAIEGFGGAPDFGNAPRWPGWGIARDLVPHRSGASAFVLDGWGGVHPVNTQVRPQSGPYWKGWDIARGFALVSDTDGVIVDGFGGIHAVGNPANVHVNVAGSPYWNNWDIARDIVLLPDASGGYVLDAWGGIHAFGQARPAVSGPYWPGWDIARDIQLRADLVGGWVFDGWGGVHWFWIG
ncbi:MAG: hypothetical protein IT198_10850 [Acidimicrobiia bacterium]|nr:hypothetical protein [Acidimicrobiia bacterium]